MPADTYFRYRKRPLSPRDCERLRDEMLTTDKPLGPQFFEFAAGNLSRDLYGHLFDGHSTYLYGSFGNDGGRPAIVLGRKGSGKSTYLNYLTTSQDVLPIPVPGWTVLDEVQGIISKLGENGIAVRSERAAYIWESLFLVTVAHALLAAGIPIREDDEDFKKWLISTAKGARFTVASVASSVLRQLTAHFIKDSPSAIVDLNVATWLLEYRFQELNKLSAFLSDALRRAKKRAIILIDNEEYVFQSNGATDPKAMMDRKLAIQGLLSLCGRFNEGAGEIQIRYCLPAEQYLLFKDLSTAPAKDFSRLHVLHWSVGELLSMIAHRYLLHLHVWKHVSPRALAEYEERVHIPIYSREGAIEFIRSVLPESIRNSRGHEEDTLVYVLRHFQVLPRQLVALFNDMLAQELRDSGSVGRLSTTTVTRSVRQQESQIADEVIKAFEPRYPEAIDVRRKVLPNMPVVFGYKDIRRFYDSPDFEHTGKSILLEAKANGHKVEVSPFRFERCLVETGMVGKVTSQIGESEIAARYLTTEYEYSLPSTLDLSIEDRLALHPIFSFQRQEMDMTNTTVLGVYPRDCDMTLEDHRHEMQWRFR